MTQTTHTDDGDTLETRDVRCSRCEATFESSEGHSNHECIETDGFVPEPHHTDYGKWTLQASREEIAQSLGMDASEIED